MTAMAKSERPLTVDIPSPQRDQPAWSRVGAIGLVGFLVGIAVPRVAGMKIGPGVPADLAKTEASASPNAAAHPKASASASAGASAVASATPPAASGTASAGPSDDETPPNANQEMVVIGPGKIVKCSDKKDKKIDDCEKLLFDPIAVKRLRELSRCPSALGLTGKLTVGFEVDFKKK